MEHTPSGGADPGTAAGEAGPLSIGAVLNVLREEFPEVTISKIRFLESEGLVEPRRSPSGYRKFRAGDVERLGQILRMQRDHYLPLKVIREQLDAVRGAGPPPVPARQPRSAAPGVSAVRILAASRRIGPRRAARRRRSDRRRTRRRGSPTGCSPRTWKAATTPRPVTVARAPRRARPVRHRPSGTAGP